jgi:hypothetical protein
MPWPKSLGIGWIGQSGRKADRYRSVLLFAKSIVLAQLGARDRNRSGGGRLAAQREENSSLGNSRNEQSFPYMAEERRAE